MIDFETLDPALIRVLLI